MEKGGQEKPFPPLSPPTSSMRARESTRGAKKKERKAWRSLFPAVPAFRNMRLTGRAQSSR